MTPTPSIDRRTVVRQLFLGSALTLFGVGLRSQSVLATESPGNAMEGLLTLSPADFPVLLNPGGSLLLTVGLPYPIVLSRASADVFYAVSSECQHSGCVVGAYSSTLGLIRCSCHGSTYQIDGTLAGGPAERSLPRYPTSYDAPGRIQVRLPATYGFRSISLQSIVGDTRRLSLVFNPTLGSTYSVQFRSDLNGPAQLIQFATTPAGSANQTSYTHNNFANPTQAVTLYVDLTTSRGFYQIVCIPVQY